MGKKDIILKQEAIIKQMQADLEGLKADQTATEEKWYTAYQYALQQKINADKIMASYGSTKNDGTTNGKLDPKIKRLWKYILPSENMFTLAYWFEANSFADWWAEYFGVCAVKPEDFEEFEMYKRCAFLWDNMGMVKIGGRWKCARLVSLDPETLVCKVSLERINRDNFTMSAGQADFSKLKVEDMTFTLWKDAVFVKMWWEGIGFYVKAIPYLGSFILFQRQLDKNMSFANIVPTININDPLQKGQLLNFLTDPDIFEINPYDDPQNPRPKQMELLFEKIKWLVPENLNIYFDAQMLYIDKKWEMLCNKFGRPIVNANGEQRLSADANTYASNSLYIANSLKRRLYVACEVLMKMGLDLKLTGAEQQADQGTGYEGNDNATKTDGQETGEKPGKE